jgi:hypothetical protein
MIRTLQHAGLVQDRRSKARKPGIAKAVRRFFKRTQQSAAVSLEHLPVFKRPPIPRPKRIKRKQRGNRKLA